MKYSYVPMNLEDATKIASWRYQGFMKEIFMDPYFTQYNEITKEMKGPGNCDGYVVYDQDDVIGLFEFYHTDEIIEIGLALHPKYVGKGLSKEFILDGIEFGIKQYQYTKEYIKITVELGNDAAYNAYVKVGFEEIDRSEDEILMRYYIDKKA